MKMILISQSNFDALFQECSNSLKLKYFERLDLLGSHKNFYTELHRKFHYEIAVLKDKLEKR